MEVGHEGWVGPTSERDNTERRKIIAVDSVSPRKIFARAAGRREDSVRTPNARTLVAPSSPPRRYLGCSSPLLVIISERSGRRCSALSTSRSIEVSNRIRKRVREAAESKLQSHGWRGQPAPHAGGRPC
jgi:hypothetical protein